MAVLPTLIKNVQDEHGSDAALELGMMLGFFDVVAELGNIKGDVVSFQVSNAFEQVPVAEKARELPRIIAAAYRTIGRNSLGAKPVTVPKAHQQSQQQNQKTDKDGRPFFQKISWKNKQKGNQQRDQGSRASSPTRPASEHTYDLRDRATIKSPDRFHVPDTSSARSFQAPSDTRRSGGGQLDRRGSTPPQGRDQPRQTERKSDEKPRFKPQFEKKKVAALTVNKDATDSANTTAERNMGSNTARQCSRSDYSQGGSVTTSDRDSN